MININWYTTVSKNITEIPSAISYYEAELLHAKKDTYISGNVEKLAASMPGIVEHRFNQLQDLEAILEYLNIELRRLRSQHFRKYLENYQRSLSSRDCERFVDGEIDVVDFEKIINDFSLLRNKWLGIIKALDNKSFSISNIIKLRAAGLDDVVI